MRYNGGKSRIAKHIAPIVNAERAGRILWEPFCGGLGMTEHLKPDIASDVHPGLINLYEALRADPTYLDGFNCTEDDYAAARALPDNHPAKAFIGFGCSFGGNWFRAYAKPHPKVSSGRAQGLVSADRLRRVMPAVSGVRFACASFFDVEPQPGFLIYADPPYAGTAGYPGVPSFNHEAFVSRCLEWRSVGSVVFVSEYGFPAGSVVWERASTGTAGAGVSGAGKRITERLYRL